MISVENTQVTILQSQCCVCNGKTNQKKNALFIRLEQTASVGPSHCQYRQYDNMPCFPQASSTNRDLFLLTTFRLLHLHIKRCCRLAHMWSVWFFFPRTNDSLFCSTHLFNQHATAAYSNLPRHVVYVVRFLTANPFSEVLYFHQRGGNWS